MSALLVLRVELEETVKMRKQTTGLARKFPLVFCTVLWANPDLPGALAVGDLPASAGGMSGHRVLIKSKTRNRGLSARGTNTRLRLEFLRETGLILRCAMKVGNPF